MPKKKLTPTKNKKEFVGSKSRSSQKLGILALGLLILLLIIAKVLGSLTSLFQPISPELNSNNQFSWDQKSTINLVFASLNPKGNNSEDEASFNVVSLNPRDQKITILNISNQTYASLPKGFGSWKVGSIYKLGQEETPPSGAKLLSLSLSSLLGLPIDGVIILPDNNDQTPQQIVEDFRKNRLNILSFTKQVKSDLKTKDALAIFWSMSQVRADQIVALDFLRSDVTQSKLLKDSTRVLGVDTVKLDLFIRQNLFDPQIAEEGKSVAVFNGTKSTGLTQNAVRMITNMGGNVTVVSNTDIQTTKTQVIVNNFDPGENNLSSATYQRIAQIFAPSCLKITCLTTDSRVLNSRAQINIILGEDYYDLYFKR